MTASEGARTWSDDMRRLRRRLGVAYTACPIAMAATVIVGRDHRLSAVLTLWATFVATHAYVLWTCLWTLLPRPFPQPSTDPDGDGPTG